MTPDPSRFHSKVVGVTKRNADGSDRQRVIKRCRTGERLELVRDRENRYDRNAVQVCRQNGQQLGLLSRELAEEIAPILDDGGIVEVEISDLTGGGWFSGKSRGVNLLITKHPAT